ncbi:hypothetical protein DIRU0_E52812 [Diutina rugosa]
MSVGSPNGLDVASCSSKLNSELKCHRLGGAGRPSCWGAGHHSIPTPPQQTSYRVLQSSSD